MKDKLITLTFFLLLFTVMVFLSGKTLLALDPQPEPPMVLNDNLKKLISISPVDKLDPQPEPPAETPELNITIKKPPLDALDPQPEPPGEIIDSNITIKKPPLDALDPQPEPPMIARDIKILLDNVPLDALDPQPEPPMLYQNRTIVPMRSIFEKLGATVEWEGTTRTITAKKGTVVIIMKIGVSSATVNGESINLDAPPLLYNNRTFVPLRFVSQALGNDVQWDEQTRTICINPSSN